METPPVLPRRDRSGRYGVTIKLLFVVVQVLLLQVPLHWVNSLRQERSDNRADALGLPIAAPSEANTATEAKLTDRRFDGYRIMERSLKHGALVVALVFAAFFLFEVLAGLPLHAVHYGLVGTALCLFYLALLRMGEALSPELAYGAAAVASSSLIVLYSAAILHTWTRATAIAGLLMTVHGVLFVVLRMEVYALLAGTAALFVIVGLIMYFTRKIDWNARDVVALEAK